MAKKRRRQAGVDYTDVEVCVGATLADLSEEAIEQYRREVSRRRPDSRLSALEPPELLRDVGAAVEGNGGLVPTLTGILFFGRNPRDFYPSFTVTFLEFPGTAVGRSQEDEPLYLDNREFSGTIPAIIEEAWGVLYRKMSKRAVVEGVRREDVPEYPSVAVREALVNAIAHRDYGRAGSFIQVRLFADRLEVQSPGGLPGDLTVDEIPYEQYTRNPHVMRLLEDYGYVERRGVGIDQMMAAMEGAGLPEPAFEDRESSFWVTLKGHPTDRPYVDYVKMGLNDRQIEAIDYLRERGRLTNREYQDLFDVSDRTALYDLKGLVDVGLALPVSAGRGRYYILRD